MTKIGAETGMHSSVLKRRTVLSTSWPLAASLVFTLLACSPPVTTDGGADVVRDTAIDARADAPGDSLDRVVPDARPDVIDALTPDVADVIEAGDDVPVVDAPAEAGDAGTPCTTAATCPLPASTCITAICTAAGFCATEFVAALVATPTQAPGDCHRNVCDGTGSVLSNVDDTDVPDDGNACTADLCTAGVASHPVASAGTSCGGTNVCDALGHCVGCVLASDCGTSTACRSFACTSGVCTSNNVTSGTVVANTTTGNCRSDQCDGLGAITPDAVDNADHPADDGVQCTLDTCSAGAPVHPPAAQGTTCTQTGGHQCNATGQCVTCLIDTECPAGGPCQAPRCTAGTCGLVAAVAHVLPAAQQVAGNCQQLSCDGTTQTPVSAADNTDVPADDGLTCTTDTCAAGAPVHPPATVNTACAQSGGRFCNGSGLCVFCTGAAQCTAANACQTPICTAGSLCSFTAVSVGTVVANATPGDCHTSQCDGAGAITLNAVDNTDIPADDGNPCTLETCTAGAPAHPPTPAGTACGPSLTCDGAGHCGGCILATDCPSGNACQTRTCTSGTCGFSSLPPGTVVANATIGDCRSDQCDGAGAIATVSAKLTRVLDTT
ncbi:MAG: hypothetical protein WCJ30_06775, partial [Deltaproteobacteria bacterium]